MTKRKVHWATKNTRLVMAIQNIFNLLDFQIILLQEEIDLVKSTDNIPPNIVRSEAQQVFHLLGKPVLAYNVQFKINDIAINPVKGTLAINQLAGANKHRYEYEHAIAYLDSQTSEPLIFESVGYGVLASLENINWNKQKKRVPLSKLLIPAGYTRTLKKMNPIEKDQWVKQEYLKSCFVDFAQWLLKNR